MENFNFDFSFVKAGPPIVTISAVGISFNLGSRTLLGFPEKVNIGYDANARAIGIRKHQEGSQTVAYEFESRMKDGWIRINAKDFSRYLEQQTGMKFRDKAKQFLPEFDKDSKTLIVVLDESHLK